MRSETEALQLKREQIEKPAQPVWIQGSRSKSWSFCCSECGEVSYYPQNPRGRDAGHAVMGYRFCPYCKAEMTGILRVGWEMDVQAVGIPGAMDSEDVMAGLDVQRFAERLQDTLKEKGLTQREVARRAGINDVQMSRYYWGERKPSYVYLYNLAAALDVDIYWLSGREDTGPD